MHPVLIICVILAGVAVIVWIANTMEKNRISALEAVAQELGLDFIDKPGKDFAHHIGKTRLFNQGRSRRATNVMQGEANGVAVSIFGYWYTTGHGKRSHTHSQTVICFHSEQMNLPDFELRPEHLFHKIGSAFGYNDIDFASHPTFSKKYLLRGPNEEAIRDLFEPEKLEFFENLGKPLVSIEAEASRLIFYRAGKRLKPGYIRDFMEEGFRVYGLFRAQS